MTTSTTTHRTLRIRGMSWQVQIRAVSVVLAAVGLLTVLVGLELSLGDVAVPLPEVLRALVGSGDPSSSFIVLRLRLPQTVVAVLVGAALALAGALTQTFARNALASPDILGITEGAAVGAVAAIVLSGASGLGGGIVGGLLQQVGVPAAAFIGALVTATLLYALAWRRGIDGQRFVLVGIGVGAALSAVTSWLLVSARIQDAASAQIWLSGSLNARGWDQAVPLLVALAVLVPVALLMIRTLNAMQLSDDSAVGLGVRLQRSRLLVLLVAVALSAAAVSAVGPLEFVAFVVPQVALRLTRGSRPPLVASMVLGACLVTGADLLTRVVIPFALPAGVVTAVIGAPYLIWLLLRGRRRTTA